MSLRLIRQDSETPNVTNHDDARMVRYAYSGRDGFVKNRGGEIGYTINGTSFIIKSGVLVLQGWEVEIDANGVSVPVSASVSGQQYYSVYLEVNCSTDSASIKSIYDSIQSPDIPASDDLTADTGGTARLLLYQFKATSGVISDVKKIVQGIDYAKESIDNLENGLRQGSIIPANAKRVNSLEIERDASGVLKIGNTVIPQKIPLWSGSEECSNDTPVTYNFAHSLLIRREIEIKGIVEDAIDGDSPSIVRFRLYLWADSNRAWVNAYSASISGETLYDIMTLGSYEFIYSNGGYTAIKLYGVTVYNSQENSDHKFLKFNVTDIYEIIE